MSVESHIRPLHNHCLGIPPVVQQGLRRMNIFTTPKSQIAVVVRTYERLLKIIDAGLKGNLPVEHEQQAADHVAHVVIDAAYLHGCLRAAGYKLVGDFPYDYLADRIIPAKSDVKPDSGV